MSLKVEGRKCVVCNSYLFDDDDVVFCPDCGAPHHRDCYSAVGKCGLEALHGTPDEYKYSEEPEQETDSEQNAERENHAEPQRPLYAPLCRRCGRHLDDDVKFCPYCGTLNISHPQVSESIQCSFNPEEELENGIKVKETIKVIAVNYSRYTHKFSELRDGKKASWNWAAFLFPHGWFAFRKMYAVAAVLAALSLASSLLFLPMMKAMQGLPINNNLNYVEALKMIIDAMMAAGTFPTALALISFAVELTVRIFSALFGDWIYKKRVISVCNEIKAAEDKDMTARKLGGINILAFFICTFATSVLYDIIAIFLG